MIEVGSKVAPRPGARPQNVSDETMAKVAPILEGVIGTVKRIGSGGAVYVKFKGIRKPLQYDASQVLMQAEFSLPGFAGVTFREDATLPPGTMRLEAGKESLTVKGITENETTQEPVIDVGDVVAVMERNPPDWGSVAAVMSYWGIVQSYRRSDDMARVTFPGSGSDDTYSIPYASLKRSMPEPGNGSGSHGSVYRSVEMANRYIRAQLETGNHYGNENVPARNAIFQGAERVGLDGSAALREWLEGLAEKHKREAEAKAKAAHAEEMRHAKMQQEREQSRALESILFPGEPVRVNAGVLEGCPVYGIVKGRNGELYGVAWIDGAGDTRHGDVWRDKMRPLLAWPDPWLNPDMGADGAPEHFNNPCVYLPDTVDGKPVPVSYGSAYQDMRTAVLGLATVVSQMGEWVGSSRGGEWQAIISEVVRPLLDERENAPSDEN